MQAPWPAGRRAADRPSPHSVASVAGLPQRRGGEANGV